MPFKMIVDVNNNVIKDCSLMLPKIFNSNLPRNTVTVTLIDYLDRCFTAKLDCSNPDITLLCGDGWTSFLQSISNNNVKCLYFNMFKENQIHVSAFIDNGFEIHLFLNKPPMIRSCLVTADESIYHQQVLPHAFLATLTRRTSHLDYLSVTLCGPIHNTQVNVTYTPTEGFPYGVASGFHGHAWTNFCFKHAIEDDYTLKFTNCGGSREIGHIFNVEIFNKYGIGIHVTNTEHCSHIGHFHDKKAPRFYHRIQNNTISHKKLTIPNKFAKKHRLFTYHTALLFYSNLTFTASLHLEVEHTSSADNTHMFMFMDWKHFQTETGLCEGQKLRFELYHAISIKNERCYFRVCSPTY